MSKLHPLGDHIIVKRSKPEEVTKSGIVLPSSSSDKSEQGEVVAIGPGKLNEKGERVPMDVKVGDKVIFKSYSLQDIKVDGEEVSWVSQEDIIAIIE